MSNCPKHDNAALVHHWRCNSLSDRSLQAPQSRISIKMKLCGAHDSCDPPSLPCFPTPNPIACMSSPSSHSATVCPLLFFLRAVTGERLLAPLAPPPTTHLRLCPLRTSKPWPDSCVYEAAWATFASWSHFLGLVMYKSSVVCQCVQSHNPLCQTDGNLYVPISQPAPELLLN